MGELAVIGEVTGKNKNVSLSLLLVLAWIKMVPYGWNNNNRVIYDEPYGFRIDGRLSGKWES